MPAGCCAKVAGAVQEDEVVVEASGEAELIRDRVWRSRSQLELAIVEYVAWFNTQRLHSALSDVPPAEYEEVESRRYGPGTPYGLKRGNQPKRSP